MSFHKASLEADFSEASYLFIATKYAVDACASQACIEL